MPPATCRHQFKILALKREVIRPARVSPLPYESANEAVASRGAVCVCKSVRLREHACVPVCLRNIKISAASELFHRFCWLFSQTLLCISNFASNLEHVLNILHQRWKAVLYRMNKGTAYTFNNLHACRSFRKKQGFSTHSAAQESLLTKLPLRLMIAMEDVLETWGDTICYQKCICFDRLKSLFWDGWCGFSELTVPLVLILF